MPLTLPLLKTLLNSFPRPYTQPRPNPRTNPTIADSFRPWRRGCVVRNKKKKNGEKKLKSNKIRVTLKTGEKRKIAKKNRRERSLGRESREKKIKKWKKKKRKEEHGINGEKTRKKKQTKRHEERKNVCSRDSKSCPLGYCNFASLRTVRHFQCS